MSPASPVRPAAVVDLAFGHSIAVTRTESGATLMIHAPGGLPDIEIEVAVTTTGATLRKRLWTSPSEPSPAPASSLPWPARPVPGAVVAPAIAKSAEPHLSVQQYASLRAECLATDSEHLPAVRSRYGLDEEGDMAEAEAWGKKFAEDAHLFDTYKHLFQSFRTAPPPRPPSIAPPGHSDSTVPSTAALSRVMTLGEHATMAAELLFSPEETVYAKYDLSDRAVRGEVLRICELRLQDANAMETWKKLHAIAVARFEK